MAETVVIRCTATDPGGLTGFATKTITVNGPAPPSTAPPEIVSITATENPIEPSGETTITVIGRNYDRVLWLGFGLSASTTPETRKFTAPANVRVGTPYVITVILTNDFDSDTDSITMTIRNVAPIINSLSGIPVSIGIGDSFEAFANATDANGDPLIYVWTAPDFTQGIAEGNPINGRAFQSPSSITGASNAVKTITCTVTDSLPPPNTGIPFSKNQNVIVSPNVPSAPNVYIFDVGKRDITVIWDPPTNNGGSPITGYRVWIRQLAASTEESDQAWDISRSVPVSSTIHRFTFESPSYSLDPGTPYEIGVQSFNTFDIVGVTYGGISERGTERITTDPLFTPPIDPTPEENFAPVVDIPADIQGHTQTGSGSITVRKTEEVLTITISGTYSDADGDLLTVYWGLSDISGTGVSISPDPIENPYQGTTTVQVLMPADTNPGRFILRLNAYDNITNNEDDPSTDILFVRIVVS